jgi:glycogenin
MDAMPVSHYTEPNPARTAYVTMLCNGDGYAPGVEALGHSLVHSGSTRARVVMVTPEVSDEACARLAGQGFDVRRVPWLGRSAREARMFARFGHTYNKLHAFGLTDFERVVLMDADTLVVRNIDDLFSRPHVAAAPDFLLPDRFNSGVLVLEPSRATYEHLLDSLDAVPSYDGGDQGFLNAYFSGWFGAPAAHRLPVGYNLPQFIYQFMRAQPCFADYLAAELRVIHYSVQKPWLTKATLVGGAALWWSMFYGARGGDAEAWRVRVHEAADWSFETALRSVLG